MLQIVGPIRRVLERRLLRLQSIDLKGDETEQGCDNVFQDPEKFATSRSVTCYPKAMLALALLLLQQTATIGLQDVFGRDALKSGITLVDWEGQIANPAATVTIVPGPKLYLPARVQISATSPRILFNLFSELGPNGCTKTVFLEVRDKPVTVYLSILPDRDGEDEDYRLKLRLTDPNESIADFEAPIHVVDQDRERGLDFQLTFDYSKDASGFFSDPLKRKIVQQAADDWAYFFADQGFDRVPAGAEKGWIWDDGFVKGHEVAVERSYQGFFLFAQGITGTEKRSGCGASEQGGFQSRAGAPTALRRSATMSMETSGNWNGKGWQTLDGDKDWWRASNMSRDKADLYSIVHHEMAHGLIFHKVHPAFRDRLDGYLFHDPVVEAYVGRAPRIIDVEHFVDTVDPVSRVGVFGNEYGGDMPRKRWLITKFDLLVAQAMGYRLRDTSPFAKLSLLCPSRADGVTGKAFSLLPKISGGIPAYFVTAAGPLPKGLELDSYSGRIQGTPTESGSFAVSLTVRDSDPAKPTAQATVTIVVR